MDSRISRRAPRRYTGHFTCWEKLEEGGWRIHDDADEKKDVACEVELYDNKGRVRGVVAVLAQRD